MHRRAYWLPVCLRSEALSVSGVPILEGRVGSFSHSYDQLRCSVERQRQLVDFLFFFKKVLQRELR
eukprot:scaffold192805_cov33-Prasinocladus_malaysianus.AAC.1